MTMTRCPKPIPSFSLSFLSPSRLKNLLYSNEPFILSHCFSDMPATKLWQRTNYFQKFNRQPIEVEVSPHDSSGYGTRHETTLGEFMTLLSHPLPYRVYMAQVPLFQKVPRLQKDVTTVLVEEILAEGELYNTSTWIGTYSLTPLHRDPRVLTNLFVQVCGRKSSEYTIPKSRRRNYNLVKAQGRIRLALMFGRRTSVKGYKVLCRQEMGLLFPEDGGIASDLKKTELT